MSDENINYRICRRGQIGMVRDVRPATELERVRTLYNDLLTCVQNKIPGESRHETAKRIITGHENQNNPPVVTAHPPKTEDKGWAGM